jgi:uncharacterized protein (TIRG00374 family)
MPANVRQSAGRFRVNRLRLGLLGLAVSAVTLYFMFYQMDMGQFVQALSQARYIYLIPTVLLLVAGLVTRAFRWRALLDHALPLGRAFSIMNVAYLVNGILPLRIGEVARMYLASRSNRDVSPLKVGGTIVVERLLDLLAVVVMIGLALALGPVPDDLRRAAGVAVPLLIGGFAVLVGFASQRARLMALGGNIAARLPIQAALSGRLLAWFDHFLEGLQVVARPGRFLQVLGWTAVSWGFSAAAGYILMFAFFEQASLSATLLYIAAAAFAIAVPAVPGNIGPYELAIVSVLGAVGYGEPASVAIAFAFVVHGINLAVHAVTGFIGLMREGLTVTQLTDGVRSLRTTAPAREVS